MLLRSSVVKHKNFVCLACHTLSLQRCNYSQVLENGYSDEQKKKILQVMNEPNAGILTRYAITKARIKHIKQWKNNNGELKSLSDIDMVEGFSDKYAKKLFDSILDGGHAEVLDTKTNRKIKRQILHPVLSENVRENCEKTLAVHVWVNSVCWTLIDRSTYEVVEWEYRGIDYPDNKRLQITDIMNIAWQVTRSLPTADIYVMMAEATTLRAAGVDSQNPKVLTVNLQRAQLVAMIVALLNARSNQFSDNDEDEKSEEILNNKVYFLKSSLPYRLFGTLVGNERVSTNQTVETIFQNIKENTNDYSQVYISEHFKSFFKKQKDLQKDVLGHCLLLSLTFMDLCIYKRKEIMEKLPRGAV